MCFGICRYIFSCGYTEHYEKIGKYKYEHKKIYCIYCLNKSKGVYKQKLREYTFCYVPLNVEKVEHPVLFCETCNKNWCDIYMKNENNLVECTNCHTVHLFKSKYCLYCGKKYK